MNQADLIKYIKKSDKKAFKSIFEQFYIQLCRFAFIILQSKEAADDVVQNTIITMWEKRDLIKNNCDIKAYLYTSVKNSSINYLKSQNTRKQYEQNYMEGYGIHTVTQFDPKTFTKRLHKALKELPEQCRIIYSLKNLEGLTYSEIAEYLQISEKTVENQINIALKKLRNILIIYRDDFYSK